MSGQLEYRVVPDALGTPPEGPRPRFSPGCGWVALIAFLSFCVTGALVSGIIEAATDQQTANELFGFTLMGAVLLSAVAVLALLGWRYRHRLSVIEAEKEAWLSQEAARVEREAREHTSYALGILRDSENTGVGLPQILGQVSTTLRKANEEYRDKAFAPFWDAVEEAARHLDVFNSNVRQLSDSAQFYHRMLEGRKHNLPALRIGSIPDPSSVVGEFRRVVRMGQTDFQFATIWEHRRTRDVLIAGFTTLGDAVNNLADAVESSVDALRLSIKSDLASVAGQVGDQSGILADQNQILEGQGQMLDNIQRRRKPPF